MDREHLVMKYSKKYYLSINLLFEKKPYFKQNFASKQKQYTFC